MNLLRRVEAEMDDEATEEDSFESAELEENSEESRWEDF